MLFLNVWCFDVFVGDARKYAVDVYVDSVYYFIESCLWVIYSTWGFDQINLAGVEGGSGQQTDSAVVAC